MATNTTEEERESREGERENGRQQRITNQATALNIASTINFTNVGQVVHISGDNNTLVLSNNHVSQQTQNITQNHPTTTTASSASTNQRGSRTNVDQRSSLPVTSTSSQPTRYAPGPPERLEILALMNKLTATLGSNWKLLAGPLSIDDADVNAIDHDEKALKLKIHKLLKLWVDQDEENDRSKLAHLLGKLPGYDLSKDCRESLNKI